MLKTDMMKGRIDSIMLNYPNLSDEDKKRLFNDLKGKMNRMDMDY
jgi:hypothetical protein